MSCRTPGWMKHKLESNCKEKYQKPHKCRLHHPMAKSKEEPKSLFMKVKEKSEEVDLKLNIQIMKIMASGPSLPGKWMGKQWNH